MLVDLWIDITLSKSRSEQRFVYFNNIMTLPLLYYFHLEISSPSRVLSQLFLASLSSILCVDSLHVLENGLRLTLGIL